MGQLLKLEEFGNAPAPFSNEDFSVAGTVQSDASQVAQHTQSFEKGYQAGWDDAAKAETEDQTRIGAELARNLQDLGFTYYEARNHVLKSLEGLLIEITGKFLPQVILQTAGEMIIQELMPIARAAVDTPTQIVMSPATRPALEPQLLTIKTIPLEILEEESLGPGQVFLRAGPLEKEIDFSAALNCISQAITALYQTNEEVLHHG